MRTALAFLGRVVAHALLAVVAVVAVGLLVNWLERMRIGLAGLVILLPVVGVSTWLLLRYLRDTGPGERD